MRKSIRLRPSEATDFAALGIESPWRVCGITAELDGRPIGIGGLVFRDGTVWASIFLTDESRRFKVTIYRAALQTLALARRRGIRRLYARAEEDRPGAEALLERLGFVKGDDGLFCWRDEAK